MCDIDIGSNKRIIVATMQIKSNGGTKLHRIGNPRADVDYNVKYSRKRGVKMVTKTHGKVATRVTAKAVDMNEYARYIVSFIKTYRDKQYSNGISTVFSGFNDAFKAQFPKADVIKVVDSLHEKGAIIRVYRRSKSGRGHAMMYLPGELPDSAFSQLANRQAKAKLLNTKLKW